MDRRSMLRRARAMLAVAGLSVIATAIVGGPAAAEQTVEVLHQAWAATGDVPPEGFAVPEDALVAAADLGSETARVGVTIRVPLADALTPLTIEMTEGEDSVLSEGARLSACPGVTVLTADGVVDADELPPANCLRRVEGVRGDDGTWRFAFRRFSERAPTRRRTILIFPRLERSSAATFRVVFARDATRAMAGEVPAPAPAPAPEPSPQPSPQPQPVPVALPAPGPAIPFPQQAPAPDPVAPLPAPPHPVAAVPPVAASTPAAPWFLIPLTVFFAVAALLARRRTVAGATASGRTVVAGTATGTPGSAVAGADGSGVAPRSSAPWGPRAAAAIVRSIDLRTATPLGRLVTTALLGGLVLLPMLGPEAIVFKFGLVLIFATAAMGLHVLVNWAGQLSLAHAAMIGVPAFIVAKLSVTHDLSPLVLLPLAPLAGALFGALVSLPALRVRGLYVTIVTLAVAIVVDRFLFSQQWLVGSGSFSLPVPSIFGVEFRTSRSLYPLLGAGFLAVVLALRALYGSKLVRALLWAKADPEAAAAAGVDRAATKIIAYTIAGALAGLAGGLTSVWVLRVDPTSFPLNLSFTYLLIVVLAGPGSVGGVIQAAAGLEAGRLIFSTVVARVLSFAGPIALIIVLTRIPTGINGHGRMAVEKLRAIARRTDGGGEAVPEGAPAAAPARATVASAVPARREPVTFPLSLSGTLVAGMGFIAAGIVAIVLAWYHTGNTDQVWIQIQEVVLGGVGGLALVIVGTGLLVRDKHQRTQELLAERLDALADAVAGRHDDPPQRLTSIDE